MQKLRVFSILNMFARPSARIVRVEALSLWRRATLLLAKWSLEVVAWFVRLVAGSIPAWSAEVFPDRNRNF